MTASLEYELHLMGRIAALEDTLRAVCALLLSLPGGVDLDADPDDTSPADAMAHVAGLAVQEIDKVLAGD